MSINAQVPDGTFVQEIVAASQPDSAVYDIYRHKVLVIGSEHFNYDDPRLPEPVALKVSTLSAVAEYVKANITQPSDLEYVINVVSPTCVQVVAPQVGDQNQQFILLQASPVLPEIVLERPIDSDRFLIQLQSCFIQDEVRDTLLKFAGKLRCGLGKEIEDDGISQTVTTNSGVVSLDKTKVSNPWQLAPFRTFTEIDQPSSPFILRLNQKRVNDTLSAEPALYLADGGAWRATAIAAIGAWLREALPNATILA